MVARAGEAIQQLSAVLLRRGPIAAALATVLGALALLSARISGHLGFELALGANLMAGALGGACGVAAARRERATPALTLTLAHDTWGPGARSAAVGAAAAVALALIPLAFALLKRIWAPGCDDAQGLLWYALLPLPSAAAAGALGALCGWIAGGPRAGFLYAAVALASLAWSLWPLWAGPQAFAYNALFGWLPGPLYDEALRVGRPLLAHRAITVAWAVSAGAACATLAPGPAGRLRPLALAAALGIGSLVLGRQPALGLVSTRESIAARLGGERETAHFVIHYPREKSTEEVERLLLDHEFRYRQVVGALGAGPPGDLHSFVYRSAEEKRELMGAAQTELSKPWRGEIHIVDRGFPHPILRHEIAHAVAASFGAPPFRVAARRGLWVNMGLTEGLAVAVEGRADELTLHQWARVLVDLGLAARLENVLAARGFWAEAPSRAYTYAGSVVAWLLATEGPEKLRGAYASGDLPGTYGRTLGELEAAHREFLAKVTVPAAGRAYAEQRLARPSIFRRSCAREVAELRRLGDEKVRRGEEGAREAAAIFARCAALDPEDPAHHKARADALAAAGDLAEAQAEARRAADHPNAGAAMKAEAGMAVGDLAWRSGDLPAALAAWSRVLELHRDRATDRLARAKIDASGNEEIARRVLPYLCGRQRPGDLVRLRELTDLEPTSALAPYLVGRALAQAGENADALRMLELALARGLAARDFWAEAHRLAGTAAWLNRQPLEARAHFASLADAADLSDAERAVAQDWLERLALNPGG